MKIHPLSSLCSFDDCSKTALVVPFSVTVYFNQTAVDMVVLCPHCQRKTFLEIGIESASGRIVSTDEMTNDEIDVASTVL